MTVVSKGHPVVDSFVLSYLCLHRDQFELSLCEMVPISDKFLVFVEELLVLGLDLDGMVLVLHNCIIIEV